MGEYRVSITDLAKQDIRGIVSYIKNDLQEPEIAYKMADTRIDAIYTLSVGLGPVGIDSSTSS